MGTCFLQIWDEALDIDNRQCYETGEKLSDPISSAYFHHVLEKEKYPEYAYSKWNIILVSLHTHETVHRDIDKCPKIKKLRNKLLEQHTKNG